MKVFAHLIVIGIDMGINKSYILSTDSEKIIYPKVEINQDNKTDIERVLSDAVINHVYVADHLISCPMQLISIDFTDVEDEFKDDLNMAFGYLIKYSNDEQTAEGSHWIEFDYINPSSYDAVILKTIQRLK